MTAVVMSPDDVVGELRSGMTIGIGGWGSRRKPMALVRAILRSSLTGLVIVSYGGPDVGLLVAGGHVRRVVTGFVSLDTIPLEPRFRLARQRGTVELEVRVRADATGNGQYLGPDPYFDDLFCLAAERAFMSCERIVPTASLLDSGPPQSLLINRAMVHGVAETPGGAHFTSCVPDYGRDEAFQARYAAAAAGPEDWQRFRADYLTVDEETYQQAVRRFAETQTAVSERASS